MPVLNPNVSTLLTKPNYNPKERTMSKTMKPVCVSCGDTFSRARKSIGYKLCMPCGDGQAKKKQHTIVPSHKSNYMVVTDMNDLKDLNPKYIRSAT